MDEVSSEISEKNRGMLKSVLLCRLGATWSFRGDVCRGDASIDQKGGSVDEGGLIGG